MKYRVMVFFVVQSDFMRLNNNVWSHLKTTQSGHTKGTISKLNSVAHLLFARSVICGESIELTI